VKYVAAQSLTQVFEHLQDDPTSKVFAGATDLVPQLRAGRKSPGTVIDLKTVPRLQGLNLVEETWVIGAATPTSVLTREPSFVSDFPGLSTAAGLIGSDQIQNRSSLGGNLCNASPAADSVPAMIVNAARVLVAGPNGERTIPVAEMLLAPGITALSEYEIVVEILIDRPSMKTADAYQRMIPRSEMDIAIVGAAACVSVNQDGICVAASVALGAVAPTVVIIPTDFLIGSKIDEQSLSALAVAAAEMCDPIDDKRGTIAYRRQVAGVLASRVTREAEKLATAGDAL